MDTPRQTTRHLPWLILSYVPFADALDCSAGASSNGVSPSWRDAAILRDGRFRCRPSRVEIWVEDRLTMDWHPWIVYAHVLARRCHRLVATLGRLREP